MADKDTIVQWLKQGDVLSVEWDAGGGSILFTLFINGNPCVEEYIHDPLQHAIATKLNLSPSHEHHNTGQGTIVLTENGEIALHYSYRQQLHATTEEESVAIELNDPEALRSQLDKVEVLFFAHAHKGEKTSVNVVLNKINGYGYTVTKEKLVPYENAVRQLLKQKLTESYHHKEGLVQELFSIDIKGQLTKDPTVKLKVERTYDWVEYCNNKTIVLSNPDDEKGPRFPTMYPS